MGRCVERSSQLRPALQQALAARRPACVNVMIERLPAPNMTRAGAAPPPSTH
jgi:thiamine pyrophosphate-dependent acetolactate synthase large subunit-like protein